MLIFWASEWVCQGKLLGTADSNIALKVFDYAFDVEVGDSIFAGMAGDVGQ